MKYLLLAVVLFSACSQSPEEQDHQKIKDYIKKQADNPSSYEPVSFGAAEKYYYSGDRNPLATSSRDSAFKYTLLTGRVAGTSSDSFEYYRAKQWHYDSLERYITSHNIADSSTQIGWVIPHSFRMTNKLGALVLYNEKFVLDMNKDSVKFRVFKED